MTRKKARTCKARIIAVYIFINALIILSASVLFISEPANDSIRVQSLISLQEARLAIKERNLIEHEANLESLARYNEMYVGYENIFRDGITEALINISDSAYEFNLTEISFETSEPTVRETDEFGERRIVEISVNAAYEGELKNIYAFINRLSEIGLTVNRFTLENREPSAIRISFSVNEAEGADI